MEPKFKLILKGRLRGAIPLEHLSTVARALKGLFSLLKEEAPSTYKAFFRKFRPVFVGIEPGSTSLVFSSEDQPELFAEESEKWFWEEVYGVFAALNNGDQKLHARKILRIAKMQSLFGADWEAIEVIDLLGDRRTLVSREAFRQAIETAKKEPFEEKRVLLGTIKKLSTQAGQKKFWLYTILGDRVEVSYPLELEEKVCSLIRKGVKAWGKALVDP
ncbi:MAG TPA: hypothetical protein EYP14_14530, partial [Planctomycetaceae bacterium]|nr:hypothetical protein [Planctomycetaceae bacterium]